jgi:hypothetical protein
MQKIEYYVGINPDDREKFEDYVDYLNSEGDWKLKTKIIHEYDDPHGYYTFVIQGTWESYKRFLQNGTSEDISWVQSLNHFEDDI